MDRFNKEAVQVINLILRLGLIRISEAWVVMFVNVLNKSVSGPERRYMLVSKNAGKKDKCRVRNGARSHKRLEAFPGCGDMYSALSDLTTLPL